MEDYIRRLKGAAVAGSGRPVRPVPLGEPKRNDLIAC